MAGLTETSSSASKIESSSSSNVFLSFRGKDTRKNFTSFLHKDLKNRGVDVFIDSKKLRTGEAIGPALCKAIEGSKIWILVLSRGYADSKWCLRELAQIVQCHRSNGRLILPIFFYVDPSHVRNQTRSFGEAFQEHEKNFNPEIVKCWRDALKFVGSLAGVVIDETGDQAELVESIVKMVQGELASTNPLAECKYPIGLDSRTNDMISLLDISSNGVQFVGICGDIGIGKTTIAKAVYNRLFLTFKRHSFLSNIREQAVQFMGLVSLQKRLLKDIFQIDDDINDPHAGKGLFEKKLCKDKVLIVLDDVDNQEQIDALAGGINWFGQGSRIIITTRDEHMLNVAKVARDKIYRPPILDYEESLQLLCKHAFSMDQPPKGLVKFSHDVAYYFGGLPINLEVLGSYLADGRIKDAWKGIFQKLNEIPQEQFYRTLKTIYDDLEDGCLKAIFPDFKWHFIEWENGIVSSTWKGSSYCLKSVMDNFMKRSVLKVEESAKYTLRMHDHRIRDTGKETVRGESLMEPGRQLSYDDILEALERHEGTGMIEFMSLLHALAGEPFQMMPKLKPSAISIQPGRANPDPINPVGSSNPWNFLPTAFYRKRGDHIRQALNFRLEGEIKGRQGLRSIHFCASVSVEQGIQINHVSSHHLGTTSSDFSVSFRRNCNSTRFCLTVDAKVAHPHLIYIQHYTDFFSFWCIKLQGNHATEVLDVRSISTHKAMSSRAGKSSCYDEDVKQVNRPSRVEEAELRAIERYNLDEDEVSPTGVEEAMLRATVTPILDEDDDEAACLSTTDESSSCLSTTDEDDDEAACLSTTDEDDDEAACLSTTDETGLSGDNGSYIFYNMKEMSKASERVVIENEDGEGVSWAMESLRLDEDNEAACPSNESWIETLIAFDHGDSLQNLFFRQRRRGTLVSLEGRQTPS